MTTKNIDEQKKYEYWLYRTNPLRRNRMIRMTERGISPKNLYEMKEEELKKLWRDVYQNGQGKCCIYAAFGVLQTPI